MSAVRNQVVSAVDLIVQVARFRNGKRRIISLTDVAGMEGSVPVLEDIWSYEPSTDRFVLGSNRPSFQARVEDMGLGHLLRTSMSSATSDLARGVARLP